VRGDTYLHDKLKVAAGTPQYLLVSGNHWEAEGPGVGNHREAVAREGWREHCCALIWLPRRECLLLQLLTLLVPVPAQRQPDHLEQHNQSHRLQGSVELAITDRPTVHISRYLRSVRCGPVGRSVPAVAKLQLGCCGPGGC
jgi:hypothetical protein